MRPVDRHPSTHPPLPPTTEDDRISWLRLLRSRRVGPATFYRLLNAHGNIRDALAALPDLARAAGAKGYTPCPEEVIAAEFARADQYGARLICRGDADYPPLLAQIPDAPPALWAIGDASLLSKPSISLVGARNASSLGLRMTRSLAGELGEQGHVISSGLARGIDAAAHKAALDTGTIAVMAGGVDVVYPAENTDLARDVAKAGLLISEQPMGLEPRARHFPSRNRIVSGLSRALVVVEAAAKSGSLITARAALDQGREVLAVPGHPFDARASGCNILIRDGAILVRGGADVLDILADPVRENLDQPVLPEAEATAPDPHLVPRVPPPTPEPDTRTRADTMQLHQVILERLGPSPVPEDQLIRDLGTSAAQVTPLLTDLEVEGKIERHPGGLLSRSG
ncbi:MAG: DNA-processing protein DprA [Pseudomonadota bacterium]